MSVLHMQGACMAAQLVAACFSCSLVHPQRAVDFATYTPLELGEGTHLFHDPYKYDPACLAPVQLPSIPTASIETLPHSTILSDVFKSDGVSPRVGVPPQMLPPICGCLKAVCCQCLLVSMAPC